MKPILQFALSLACVGGSALAVDVDINIGHEREHSRVVEVQQAPVIERTWIADVVIHKSERIEVSPPHIERRAETVCVAPARVEVRQEQVLAAPPRVEVIREKVLIHPARIERRKVEGGIAGDLKIGSVKIKGVLDDDHWENVEIPAEYEVVERKVVTPARYETVSHEFNIPAKYETITKEVQVAGVYKDVSHDVVIPGHYEERTVVAPPTTIIVEKRPRPLIDIDLDFSKKKKHDDDR